MFDQASIALAQAVAALGATGILALLFVLWISGRLHSPAEMKAREDAWRRELDYREKLREEAVLDRREADARVDKLTDAVKDSNRLTERSLDLNERLMDDFIRSPDARTRRTDRVRTD